MLLPPPIIETQNEEGTTRGRSEPGLPSSECGEQLAIRHAFHKHCEELVEASLHPGCIPIVRVALHESRDEELEERRHFGVDAEATGAR